MTIGPVEVYAPRAVSDLGVWDVGALRVKVYGLIAEGQSVTGSMKATARRVLDEDVTARVAEMGECNGLGFVIIHPGETGLSITSHWWIQGCVMCQHFFRQVYGADAPIKAGSRPVIGCVWELALIDAESRAWRQWMMGDVPDAEAYLAARPEGGTV